MLDAVRAPVEEDVDLGILIDAEADEGPAIEDTSEREERRKSWPRRLGASDA